VNHVWTIAKKELRGSFGSPVALIFLATFLGLVLFTFFWEDSFFARGAADLRPMFDWMPLFLIFLIASLSMRMWSEEQKAGTIEVLLTLPVPHWQLVAGKFLAGLALVAIALGLTLGLPLTVSMMGNLDWGPVVGGYLAALLLAAAYLAIGMCVSAATDSQIVSLIATALVCGLLYLPGTSQVADQAGMGAAQVLRGIGSGSRFTSVARGVLDLRDLAYYGSLVAIFLGVNVLLLARHRWSDGARTRARRRNLQIAVALVAGNAFLLPLWLAPVAQARVDLTEGGEYSLSETTESLLTGLDEPLLIRAYFSEKTHPLLAPLVPRVKDLLDEYRAVGGTRVRVEVVDPSKDEKLEDEAKELYNITSVPLSFASRTERSVLNAYFHILVAYGDQHEVLTFNDLIEVKPVGVGDVQVGLKNLEYDLTRTIKKVTTGFQSVDAMFASLPGKATLTAYMTPDSLPENWKEAPALLDKVVAELGKESGGKLEVKKVEPKTEAEMETLFKETGIRPFMVLGGETFYFTLVLQVGDRAVRVMPAEEITEASLRTSLTEALKRAVPGFTKVVALWVPPAPPPMQLGEGMPPQRMPAAQQFQTLKRTLAETYEVRDADLTSGKVGDDVDVLILAGPASLDDKPAQAVDQFLMRGGAVIALVGRYRLDLMAGKLGVEKVTTGLEDVLAAWGVTVKETMVLDEEAESLPIPVRGKLQAVRYPYFVRIAEDRLAAGNAITAGLPGAIMHWASPVTATSGAAPAKDAAKPDAAKDAARADAEKDAAKAEARPRKVDVLVRSSDGSWLDAGTEVEPDFAKSPTGFAPPADLAADQKGAQTLAVAITGGFPSYVAGKKKAQQVAGSAPEADAAKGAPDNALIEFSPPDARLVVFGSSAFVSDDILGLSQQLGADIAAANVQLVQNAVDWALVDTDLLAIRTRASAARALTVPEDERGTWEWINYGIAFLGLGLVVLATWLRRRAVRPIALSEVTS
jgi:ABC-2 type transport system permease protein